MAGENRAGRVDFGELTEVSQGLEPRPSTWDQTGAPPVPPGEEIAAAPTPNWTKPKR